MTKLTNAVGEDRRWWGVKRGEMAEEAKPIKLGMASRP